MAPSATPWSAGAELDLVFALLSEDDSSTELKVRPEWNKVLAIMTAWGYGFTKEALSSRWSKKITKDFKTRRTASGVAGAGASDDGGRKRKRARALPKDSSEPATKRVAPTRGGSKGGFYKEADEAEDHGDDNLDLNVKIEKKNDEPVDNL